MNKPMIFKDFKLHFFKGYVQNNYIAEYENRILFIDGASRPDVPEIVQCITTDLGSSMDKLKLMAVTHCHPDHSGAAGILRKKYGTAVAAPHEMDRWYSGIGGALQHISDTLQSKFMARQLDSEHRLLWYSRRLRPDYSLYDGDSLPFFPDWTAIAAPGHTSHNMHFFNKNNGVMYIADTIIDSNGKYLPPVPVLFPGKMVETLLRIKEIRPDMLLLAHGPSQFYRYNEKMIDDTIKKIETGSSAYIRMFYKISKFTGEYRRKRKIYKQP